MADFKDVPPEFLCPISMEIMTNPTLNEAGQTYEYQSIVQWYAEGHRTDPLTRKEIKNVAILIPVHSLKSRILEWKQTYPQTEKKRMEKEDFVLACKIFAEQNKGKLRKESAQQETSAAQQQRRHRPDTKQRASGQQNSSSWQKKDMVRWSYADVEAFVAQVSAGDHWQEYAEACVSEKVDGGVLDVIGDDHSIATDLGFDKVHAIVLSKAIRTLKAERKAKKELADRKLAEKLARAEQEENDRKVAENIRQREREAIEAKQRAEAEDRKKVEADKLYSEGFDYYFGNNWKTADKKRGKQLIVQAMKQGSVVAKGECYYYGWGGLPKDYKEAVKWYKMAANQGNARAQYNLGVCYKFGKGVEKDWKEAVKWCKMAADQGNSHAQYNLGICYQTGQGVEKDYKEAVKWYKMAANQGNARAQYNLGVCYDDGEGVDINPKLAAFWYCKAAAQGDANAKRWLGELLKKHPSLWLVVCVRLNSSCTPT